MTRALLRRSAIQLTGATAYFAAAYKFQEPVFVWGGLLFGGFGLKTLKEALQ
jgi:hypothetical protein